MSYYQQSSELESTKKPPQPVHLIKKTKQSTAFSLTGFDVLTLQHSSQTNQAVPGVSLP